jgi:serine/threonine protein kinase
VEQQQSLLPKTIFDERYEILSVAGEGGMGKVYRARHVNLDKIVAIKILRQEFALNLDAVRRFKQEAQMASDLSHPNIAGVQAFGVVENQPYIVFDFLDGHSLQTALDQGATFSFAEFLNVFKQAVGGVAHAHEHGVIHRDLKPANIFLLGDDLESCTVTILDFGIAKAIESANASGQKLTATGVLLGTPLYMSPEQGRGEKVSYSADVYSLGCVMYHAIFGKLPFEGGSAYETMFNHSYTPLVLDMVPDGYPEGILSILEKSMAKQPADRYQNAAELLEALQELSKQAPAVKQSRSLKAVTKKPPVSKAVSAKAGKSRFSLQGRFIPFIPVMAIALGAGCWWSFFRNPVAGIENDWRKNYDTAALRSQLAEVNRTRPHLAEKIIKDLREDLITHPSLDGVSIFFDQAEIISGPGGTNAASPYLDDGFWILRELHEDAWRLDPERAKKLTERWVKCKRWLAGPDEDGKMFLFLARDLKSDCNQAGANMMCDMAVQQLMPLRIDRGDIAKLSDEVADLFAGNGDKMRGLQLAAIGDRSTDPSLQYTVASRKASIFDSLSKPQQALVEWKKAAAASSRDDGATTEMKLRAAQGAADDQAAVGNAEVALREYAKLRVAAKSLPNSPFKWEVLVRLGDGYAALGHEREANEIFAYGLAESRAATAAVQSSDNRGLSALAQITAGRFLNHMDKAESGIPEMDKAFPLTLNLIPHDLKPIHDILNVNRPLAQEQIRAAEVIGKLNGAKKQAAVAAASEALRQSLVAEWCEFRRDDLGAAEHQALACYKRGEVVGNSTVPDAFLAASYYVAAEKYFEAEPLLMRVLESTETTPDQRMLSRLMLADSFFHRGDYGTAKRWYFRTLHDLQRTKNTACVEGFLNFALIEVHNHAYTDAIDDANNAYTLSHEFGYWNPQFRHAGFLVLKMYRITNRWPQAAEFWPRLQKDVKPRP